ncbi:hypothetical protein ACFLTK_02315 [Chloroflexota bacterium]
MGVYTGRWATRTSIKNDKAEIVRQQKRLEAVTNLLSETYTRWEELEQLKNELRK